MPVLTATGAGVRHHRRWLFRDLDITAEPGDIVAVTGVPGSGRTTVLLALARHFRLTAGKVTVNGTAALGYVPDVTSPEPVLTVAEQVRERLALLGRSSRDAGAILTGSLYGLDPALKGWQLTPLQKHLLGLGLARLADPAVIALDGIDDRLDSAELAELWEAVAQLAAGGITVVVTAREINPDQVTAVIRLSDPQAPPTTAPPESAETGAAPEAADPITGDEVVRDADSEAGQEGGGDAADGDSKTTESADETVVDGSGNEEKR